MTEKCWLSAAFFSISLLFLQACGQGSILSDLIDEENLNISGGATDAALEDSPPDFRGGSGNNSPLPGAVDAEDLVGEESAGGSGGGGGGGGGGGNQNISVSGLSMSSAISLVTAEEDQGDAGGAANSKTRKGLSGADFDDPNTDYSDTQSRFHVDMEALEPLDMANFIMCFIKQLAPSTVQTLNRGAYLALVDEDECEKGASADNSAQTGASSDSQSVSYSSVVVQSIRSSNDAAQVVKVWVLPSSDNEPEIRAEAIVAEGISEDAPFGIFEMNWAEVDPTTNTVYGQGSLAAISDDPETELPLPNDGVGISFFMESSPRMGDEGGGGGPDFDNLFGAGARFVQAAAAVLEPDENGDLTSGVATTQMKIVDNLGNEIDIDDTLSPEELDEIGGSSEVFSRTFAIAYNDANMLIQKAPLFEDLPYNHPTVPDANSGTCFSRTEFDQAIWCYELFDADSGDALDLEQGFPFTYSKVGCDEGDEKFGYIGYWGIWSEGQHSGEECALENGDTIERKDYNDENNSGDTYQILQTKGKLIRHTVNTLALTELRGINFETWSLPGDHNHFGEFDPEADPFEDLRSLRDDINHEVNNWVVNYLTIADDGAAADGFYVVGYMTYGNHGPQLTLLSEVVDPVGIAANYDVTPSRFDGEQLWMYSPQLGGDVKYTKDAAFITYNRREKIDPNDEVFGNDGTDDLDLNCLFQCPIGDIVEGDLATYDGPFEPFNDEGINPVAYTFVPESMMLENGAFEEIALVDGESSTGHYMWGIHSGPMVTADVLAGLSEWWDVFDAPGSVFYTWETGTNEWNRAIFAKNTSDNQFASFDKPIEFSYTHDTLDDRLDDDTYDGKTYLLGYGGKCNLWGIPSINVGENDHGRWYPAFGLKDGTIVGDSDQYVVKAIEGEQFPQETPGQCGILSVSDPAIDLPSEVLGSPSHIANSAPNVSDQPPLVVAGEVQGS